MAVVNHACYNFLVTRPSRMFALTMGHNNVLDVFDASTFPCTYPTRSKMLVIQGHIIVADFHTTEA